VDNLENSTRCITQVLVDQVRVLFHAAKQIVVLEN